MAVALVVAAGAGERLGAGRPKAFVGLCGKPLVQWSVDALQAIAAIDAIVVALPPGHALADAPAGTIGVAGGASRSESVRNALAAAPANDTVLVHDAARPLITAELAARVIAALERPARGRPVDGAVAATPVTDTIKRAGSEPPPLVVAETLDRDGLWAVQTPQAFRRAALAQALATPAHVLASASDDAWLVERAGGTVVIVPAPPENLKVTSPVDLAVAEMLLAGRASAR